MPVIEASPIKLYSLREFAAIIRTCEATARKYIIRYNIPVVRHLSKCKAPRLYITELEIYKFIYSKDFNHGWNGRAYRIQSTRKHPESYDPQAAVIVPAKDIAEFRDGIDRQSNQSS